MRGYYAYKNRHINVRLLKNGQYNNTVEIDDIKNPIHDIENPIHDIENPIHDINSDL